MTRRLTRRTRWLLLAIIGLSAVGWVGYQQWQRGRETLFAQLLAQHHPDIISAGVYETCAITTAGALTCWGSASGPGAAVNAVPLPTGQFGPREE